jgi:hypothetical protein
VALINLQTQKPSLRKSIVSSSVFRSSAPIASVAKIPFGGVAKSAGFSPKPLEIGKIDQPSEPSPLHGVVDALRADVQSLRQEQNEAGELIGDIGNALAADFANRITEEKAQNLLLNKERIKLRRKEKEDNLEKKTASNILGFKSGKKGAKLSNKGILGKLVQFFTTIGAGIALTTAFDWLDNENNRHSISKFFSGMKDNWKWIVGGLGALIALDIGVKLVAVATAVKGLMLLLANPFVWAGVGILIAASHQGLGSREKEILGDLEAMGGPTQENRLKLMKILEDERDSKPIRDDSYYRHALKFLDTGQYGYGSQNRSYNWSMLDNISDIDQKAIGGQSSGWTIVGERGPELLNLPINSHVVPNHALNRNLALNRGKTTIINMPPEIIEGKLPEIKGDSSVATSVDLINSMNALNSYMTETPSILGISV